MLNTIKIYLATSIIINNQKCSKVSKSIQSDKNDYLYSLFKKEPFSKIEIDKIIKNESDSEHLNDSENLDDSDNSYDLNDSDDSDNSDDSNDSDDSDNSDDSNDSDDSDNSDDSIILNKIIKYSTNLSKRKKKGAVESDLKYQYDISDLLKIMNN